MSAARWHKGTPIALRGTWTHKDKAPLGSDVIVGTKKHSVWVVVECQDICASIHTGSILAIKNTLLKDM